MFALVVVASAMFAFVNGMNDLGALSSAPLATRAAHLSQAKWLAAMGACAGIIFGGESVAATISRDLLVTERLPAGSAALAVWAAAVTGALGWGAAARRLGVPTSATHAFVGSLLGSAIAVSGDARAVHWGGADLAVAHRVCGVVKVACGLLVSPLLGFVAGWALFAIARAVVVRGTPRRNQAARALQWPCLLAQSWFYGANDGHLVIGLLTGAAGAAPRWAHLLVAGCITLGALHGSAAVIRRLGRGLLRLAPMQALGAQTAAAASIAVAAMLGAPASSTQVTASSLVGVGGAWRARHVRWRQVRVIVTAWMVTMPIAALVGGAIGVVLRLFC